MAAIGALPHVQEAFQELERLLNLVRNKPTNAPAIKAAENAVYRGLCNVLEVSGSLAFDVEDDTTRLSGTALHSRSVYRSMVQYSTV